MRWTTVVCALLCCCAGSLCFSRQRIEILDEAVASNLRGGDEIEGVDIDAVCDLYEDCFTRACPKLIPLCEGTERIANPETAFEKCFSNPHMTFHNCWYATTFEDCAEITGLCVVFVLQEDPLIQICAVQATSVDVSVPVYCYTDP